MSRPHLSAGLALAAGVALLVSLRDRRAIATDPKHATLNRDRRPSISAIRSWDGTILHVEEHGPVAGPPIVLVHGWSCSARFWSAQLEALAEHHRVVLYDLRGHGQSDKAANGDYSIESRARDLAVVLKAKLNRKEKAVVGGHSLGAMTLAALAQEGPEVMQDHVAAIALINTGMGDLINQSLLLGARAAGSPWAQAFGRGFLTAPGHLPRRSGIVTRRAFAYAAMGPAASPAEISFCERMIVGCSPDVRAACGGTLSRIELESALEKMEIPAIVVAGGADRLTPPRHASRLAEVLASAEVHVEPDAGHMMPVTHAQLVNEVLQGLARERDAAA